MTAVQPRFIATPHNPEARRGKWTLYDSRTGERYELFGMVAVEAKKKEIERDEVLDFLDLEAGAGKYRLRG